MSPPNDRAPFRRDPDPPFREKPFFLCLTGIDASGKSSLAERLKPWIESRGKFPTVRVCGVWDVLQDPDLNLGFMGHPDELRAYLLKLHPDSRSLFLFHALLEGYFRAIRAQPSLILFVGYWYKYFVTESLHGADEPLMEPVTRLFEEPDLTLFLDIDPSEAARRRTAFTRYECGGEEPGPEPFVSFQNRCRKKLLGLQGSREFFPIDASGSEDDVFRRITAFLVEADGRF